MGKIDREWLRRIPGYRENPVPGLLKDEQGRPFAPSPPDEEDLPPGEADGDETEEPGTGMENAPIEPPPLSVPDEVESERQEKEERERFSRLNLSLAPKAFELEGRYIRVLASRFARMVSKVAEDSADMPVQGDEEWDMAELLQRRFTGRMVSQCRMTREKRKVAVVLDTSPSCEHQARLFASVARVAEELGDCDLYDAPNFSITARHTGSGWVTLPDEEQEWQFQKRVVLAFGDFDGIDRIAKASRERGNRIYWFSCEERPSVMEMNRETLVRQYRGHYLPATNLNELMQAMRRVR